MKKKIKTECVTTSDLERPKLGSDALILKQGKRKRAQKSLWVDMEAGDAAACIAGTTYFAYEYLVLPVNASSRNAYFKFYEVDTGPEEPRLEEYTGFYTEQECVNFELGNSQFFVLEHYKPEVAYLSRVRQKTVCKLTDSRIEAVYNGAENSTIF